MTRSERHDPLLELVWFCMCVKERPVPPEPQRPVRKTEMADVS
jgi:hypothetical protein